MQVFHFDRLDDFHTYIFRNGQTTIWDGTSLNMVMWRIYGFLLAQYGLLIFLCITGKSQSYDCNCKYNNWHTSIEASLRKMKCLKHSTNAEVSQKPIQKFWDVSQLLWMGKLSDNPTKHHFFQFFLPINFILGVKTHIWPN